MGKKTAIRTKHAPHFYVIFAAVTFFIGVFVTLVYQNVFAQGAEIIYACVHKNSGDVRIVSASDSCKSNENALNWNQQGPQGVSGADSNLPFSCSSCVLFPMGDKFKGKDLSYSQISKSDFRGADLTGIIFKGAFLTNNDFSDTNLTNADFTDANSYPNKGSISGTFSNANLTNANFTNANLKFTNGMNTAIVTGVIWNNTICPDGTNSNNNGNTCEGHF